MPKNAAPAQRKVRRRTRPLWPDVGQELGLGKHGTYAAARAGQIPGARQIGQRWLVFTEIYERALTGSE